MPQGKGTYGSQVGRPKKKITKPKGGMKKPMMKGKNPAAGGPDYFSKMKKMRGMK